MGKMGNWIGERFISALITVWFPFPFMLLPFNINEWPWEQFIAPFTVCFIGVEIFRKLMKM